MTRINRNNIQLGESFVVSIEDCSHKAKIQAALEKEQEIIANAEQRAADMIEQANQQVMQLMQAAEQEALSRVEEITQQAHNAGFEAGRQEGYADITNELRDKVIAVNDFAYSNFDIKNNIVKSAHSDIIRLVIEIAQKVCSTALTLDDNIIKELTLQAINSLKDKEEITIIVHPEMAQKIYAISDELRERIPQLSSIKIIEDASVSPDGTIVESPMSRVDSRVTSQIGEIAQRLMGKLDSTSEAEEKPPKEVISVEETGNREQGTEVGERETVKGERNDEVGRDCYPAREKSSCHCEEEQSSDEVIQIEETGSGEQETEEANNELQIANSDLLLQEAEDVGCVLRTATNEDVGQALPDAQIVESIPEESVESAEEIPAEIEQEIETMVEEQVGEDGFVDLADQDIQVSIDDVQS